MDPVLMSLITLVFTLLVAYVWTKTLRKYLQIPAVPGWPILGNITQVDLNRPDLTLLKWAKEFGPIYSVKFLNQTWIIVSGYDEVYEMLVTKGKSFAGRNNKNRFDFVTSGNKDIISGNPRQPHWTPLRKAAHRGIRHYGTGLTRLESTLSIMASDFVSTVRSYNGKPIDLREDIYNFILKVCT